MRLGPAWVHRGETGARMPLGRDAHWSRGSRNLELMLHLLPGAAPQSLFQSTADAWSLFRV